MSLKTMLSAVRPSRWRKPKGPPEYDSLEMDDRVREANVGAQETLGRPMNPTEEHLFRQWESDHKFSTIGD